MISHINSWVSFKIGFCCEALFARCHWPQLLIEQNVVGTFNKRQTGQFNRKAHPSKDRFKIFDISTGVKNGLNKSIFLSPIENAAFFSSSFTIYFFLQFFQNNPKPYVLPSVSWRGFCLFISSRIAIHFFS